VADPTYYGDFDEFFDRMEEGFELHHRGPMDENRFEWLEAIWDEYNVEGHIDWSNHGFDSAWYMYMTEVLDYSYEDIERYM
jgi:hypothetical protein